MSASSRKSERKSIVGEIKTSATANLGAAASIDRRAGGRGFEDLISTKLESFGRDRLLNDPESATFWRGDRLRRDISARAELHDGKVAEKRETVIQQKRFGRTLGLPSTAQIVRELKIVVRHDADVAATAAAKRETDAATSAGPSSRDGR